MSSLQGGAEYTLNLPSWAGGTKTGSLVKFSVDGTIDENRLTATGDIEILAGFIKGNGSVELNWQQGFFHANTAFNIFDGLIRTTTDFWANTNLDIFLHGNATISVPDFIPFFGGTQLADGSVVVQFTKE